MLDIAAIPIADSTLNLASTDLSKNIIELIKKDQKIEPGSYKGRKSAEPENNRSTLMDSKNA